MSGEHARVAGRDTVRFVPLTLEERLSKMSGDISAIEQMQSHICNTFISMNQQLSRIEDALREIRAQRPQRV